MRLYRIARSAHALDLTGEGARLHGGRWTPPGLPAIYTAEHPALAALEILVHFGLPTDAAPLDHRLIAIEAPQTAVDEMLRLPSVPADTASSGRHWLESGASLLLAVPSVVVPESTNVIINPRHPDIAEVSATDLGVFLFDSRLSPQQP